MKQAKVTILGSFNWTLTILIAIFFINSSWIITIALVLCSAAFNAIMYSVRSSLKFLKDKAKSWEEAYIITSTELKSTEDELTEVKKLEATAIDRTIEEVFYDFTEQV